MITSNDVYELCKLIVSIILALFCIIDLVLIMWKLICLLYKRMFSPTIKIRTEWGLQYELLRDMFDLIDNEIQTVKCNDKRLQLKGEILRIKNYLDSYSDTNNISDEEKGKVLNKLLNLLKDFYDRMNAESDSDKGIYHDCTEDINKLCSNIKDMLNEPSESYLTKLKKKIINIFCNKHKNPNIESIKNEINQHADKIKKEVEKIKQAKDYGQAQQ